MTAFALRPRSLSRRLAAAAVTLAYAFPLTLGAVAEVSHGAFHAIEGIQQRRAEAAALGLVHLNERSGYTHTHGGVTHSHAGTVDALLVAAQQTDEQTDAAPPLVELSVHTPASVVALVIAPGAMSAAKAIDAVAPPHPRALPPVPPPRA
jgi:hypothetical protein